MGDGSFRPLSHLVKPVACVYTREFIRSLPAGLRLDVFFITRQYLLGNQIRIIRVGVSLLLVVLFNFSKGGVNLGQNAI